MKIQRQERGEDYYFIGARKLEVIKTKDWYFYSDNGRWDEGNYFLSAKAANACRMKLQSLFPELFEKIAREEAHEGGPFVSNEEYEKIVPIIKKFRNARRLD